MKIVNIYGPNCTFEPYVVENIWEKMTNYCKNVHSATIPRIKEILQIKYFLLGIL